ncbi:MAG: SPOR domain-containing protein [Acidobacteria bacterium]|nr:SPOR domain-containing protein [Acidobacteriota bacterium]
MSDEAFHEIQLNGKQLVFLFMAATVVAVVIFLCGVMVGRGVPTRAESAIGSSEQAGLDPTATLQGQPAAQAVASTGAVPSTAQETLTYPALLEDPDPPAETLKPPVEPAADLPAPVVAPRLAAVAARPAPAAAKPAAVTPRPGAVAPRPEPVAPPPAVEPRPAPVALPPTVAPQAVAAAPATAAGGGTLAEPSGTGFVVQVAAVRQQAEANAIARRLSTKGYPAFVTTAGANFRVRVGKYNDRREAESVAGRLEKEEQFKPWITR